MRLNEVVELDEEHVKQELISLNSKKSAISDDIPVRILKQFCDAYLPLLTSIINSSLLNGNFPEVLK